MKVLIDEARKLREIMEKSLSEVMRATASIEKVSDQLLAANKAAEAKASKPKVVARAKAPAKKRTSSKKVASKLKRKK